MGRTLHYTLCKREAFTAADITNIGLVNATYSGKSIIESGVWTCDSFFLPPKNIGDLSILSGKTTVLGNEFNAQMVLEACLHLSVLIKDSYIDLQDTGRYLLSPIVIKDGLASPILSHKLSCVCGDIPPSDRRLSAIIDSAKHSDNATVVAHAQDLETLCTNLNLNDVNTYYVSDVLDTTKWLDPTVVTRPVNKDDFYAYAIEPSNILGGFYGEYWGLSEIDVELESYLSLARIQDSLTKKGLNPTLKFAVVNS